VRHFPAREAQWRTSLPGCMQTSSPPTLPRAFNRLYTHQAAAAEAVRGGKNVVIVTPTASGKTLCYNLPVLNAVLENSDARRAVPLPYQSPRARTSSRNSTTSTSRLEDRFGVFTYDGDTPADARKAIRGKKPHRSDQSGHASHGIAPLKRAMRPERRQNVAQVAAEDAAVSMQFVYGRCSAGFRRGRVQRVWCAGSRCEACPDWSERCGFFLGWPCGRRRACRHRRLKTPKRSFEALVEVVEFRELVLREGLW